MKELLASPRNSFRTRAKPIHRPSSRARAPRPRRSRPHPIRRRTSSPTCSRSSTIPSSASSASSASTRARSGRTRSCSSTTARSRSRSRTCSSSRARTTSSRAGDPRDIDAIAKRRLHFDAVLHDSHDEEQITLRRSSPQPCSAWQSRMRTRPGNRAVNRAHKLAEGSRVRVDTTSKSTRPCCAAVDLQPVVNRAIEGELREVRPGRPHRYRETSPKPRDDHRPRQTACGLRRGIPADRTTQRGSGSNPRRIKGGTIPGHSCGGEKACAGASGGAIAGILAGRAGDRVHAIQRGRSKESPSSPPAKKAFRTRSARPAEVLSRSSIWRSRARAAHGDISGT